MELDSLKIYYFCKSANELITKNQENKLLKDALENAIKILRDAQQQTNKERK